MPMPSATAPTYLAGYPAALQAEVQTMLAEGTLAARLTRRYGGSADVHGVRTDGMLYDYTMALKTRHLRKSSP